MEKAKAVLTARVADVHKFAEAPCRAERPLFRVPPAALCGLAVPRFVDLSGGFEANARAAAEPRGAQQCPPPQRSRAAMCRCDP